MSERVSERASELVSERVGSLPDSLASFWRRSLYLVCNSNLKNFDEEDELAIIPFGSTDWLTD